MAAVVVVKTLTCRGNGENGVERSSNLDFFGMSHLFVVMDIVVLASLEFSSLSFGARDRNLPR